MESDGALALFRRFAAKRSLMYTAYLEEGTVNSTKLLQKLIYMAPFSLL